MTFGARLRKLREEKGLTQDELGRGLGTDGADAGKQVVLGWEKGRHFPKVDQLALLCGKLGCSADYLLTGAGNDWPFSVGLRQAVARLDPPALLKLENIMRATFGMQPIQELERANVRTNKAIDIDQGQDATEGKSLTDELPSAQHTDGAREAGARSLTPVPKREPVWPDDKALLGPRTAPPKEDGKHGASSRNRGSKRKGNAGGL